MTPTTRHLTDAELAAAGVAPLRASDVELDARLAKLTGGTVLCASVVDGVPSILVLCTDGAPRVVVAVDDTMAVSVVD